LIAVSAIGRPSGFERSLKLLNLKFSEHIKFADHYQYSQADAQMLQEKMKKQRLVTTEKDFIKLRELSWPAGSEFLILCQRVEVSPITGNPYELIVQKTGLSRVGKVE
jgi:tetraacyldisaccharide-1-P 4'-kinase